MKKSLKIFILIVALIVPSLIYLFLRRFGNNNFEIPIFYKEGVKIEGCAIQSKKPYIVEFENYPLTSAQLFYFPQWVNTEEFYRQCIRIKDKHPEIMFTAIADTTLTVEFGHVLVVADKPQLYKVANCALVWGQDAAISKPLYNQIVLVDAKKRIRGYYVGNQLEDMDRLDIELDILNRENATKRK